MRHSGASHIFLINSGQYVTLRTKNEEVLHRVKEERIIVHTIKRRKDISIGHIVGRNCLLKHVIKGKRGRQK
jgi:hypothetical protein